MRAERSLPIGILFKLVFRYATRKRPISVDHVSCIYHGKASDRPYRSNLRRSHHRFGTGRPGTHAMKGRLPYWASG